MKVGERIKKRRKELGMTVDELAERVGKSRATVYRYENGSIEKLPLEVVTPFAEALDLDPGYLMGWACREHPQHITFHILRHFSDYVKRIIAHYNTQLCPLFAH